MSRPSNRAIGQVCLIACFVMAGSQAWADGANVSTNPPAYQGGSNSLSQTPSGGLRVQPQDGAGNDVSAAHPFPTTNGTTSSPLTPAAISPAGNLTLTAGGTSQALAAAAACPNYIIINNATTAAGEGGIAAPESVYVNPTGSAATATGGGSSVEIGVGATKTILAQTTAVTWIAATTGHKINAYCE